MDTDTVTTMKPIFWGSEPIIFDSSNVTPLGEFLVFFCFFELERMLTNYTYLCVLRIMKVS